MARALVFLLENLCLLALLAPCASDGDEPWEWAGVFSFAATGHYVWTAARSASGSYAATNLTLIVKSVDTATATDLSGAHSAADALWDGAVTTVAAGGEIEAVDKAYRLMMDARTWVTQFELHVDSPGAYAFFAAPAPTDFENGFHYLRTEAGVSVEPVLEESSRGHSHNHGHNHNGGEELAHAQAALCPAEQHWEWAGAFDLESSGWYTWSAARGAGGSYADASMKLLLLSVENTSEHELEDAAQSAMPLWDGGSTAKTAGEELVLGALMELTFDAHSWMTHFYLNAAAGGHVAIFAQHLPTEFENGFHYLKTEAGVDVEPAVEKACAPTPSAGSPAATPATTSHSGLWGAVFVGALVTCLPTLLGLLFIFPEKAVAVRDLLERLKGPIDSFASGAIFAAAVFLLLPEALHLAGSGHSEEVVGTWTWGTSILLGWFTCLLLIMANKAWAERSNNKVRVISVVGKTTEKDDNAESETDLAKGPEDASLVLSKLIAPVLFGDFFHNFADGLVIGVAFRVCGAGFGWELVGVTVAHELPQEVADLCILVLNAHMKWWKATTLNLLCSLSTVVGALITYGADVGSNEEGYILAYGAGVYLFVAITELGQSVAGQKDTTPGQGAVRAVSFVIGAILLGLVLLNHEHCSAPPPVAADGTAAPVESNSHHHH